MARKLSPCGTYAAARRHQRRGETLDHACADALAAYNADAQARRRGRLTRPPAVVAIAPPTATIEHPWVEWEPYTPQPVETKWTDSDPHEFTENYWSDMYPTVEFTGRARQTYTAVVEIPEDAVRQVVAAWQANQPGAGDMLATLPGDLQYTALTRLGYSPGQPPLYLGGDAPTTWTWTDDTPKADKLRARAEQSPWPTTIETTTIREYIEMRRGYTVVDGAWVHTERIVRAPEGTEIPDGWAPLGEGGHGWMLDRAPWPLTADEAVTEWDRAHQSDRLVTVVAPTDGGVDVWRGIGEHSGRVGRFTSLDDVWEHIDGHRYDPTWFDAPGPTIVVASGPGWDDVQRGETRPDTPETRAALAATLTPR